MKRLVAVLIAVGALAMQGCGYLQDRVSDAADMMDLGVTVSPRPQFAAYGCAFGLASAGYGHLDGHVAGLFGGRVGVQSLSAEIWGAGPVGAAELQVGDAEAEKYCTGAVCIVRETPEGITESTSCCHYLHLGFLGLAGNLHYKEIVDFFGGFVGFDVAHDDVPAAARRLAASPSDDARLAVQEAPVWDAGLLPDRAWAGQVPYVATTVSPGPGRGATIAN